jgi:hypothetical protein
MPQTSSPAAFQATNREYGIREVPASAGITAGKKATKRPRKTATGSEENRYRIWRYGRVRLRGMATMRLVNINGFSDEMSGSGTPIGPLPE